MTNQVKQYRLCASVTRQLQDGRPWSAHLHDLDRLLKPAILRYASSIGPEVVETQCDSQLAFGNVDVVETERTW